MPDCKRDRIEQEDKRRGKKYLQRRLFGLVSNFVKTPKGLIYVSGALSMWGDCMWHFALSVFLIKLYGHNLLLTAVVGLIVAGSVAIFGPIVGDWVDRNPRIKVAHGSLFIQDGSVILCSVILILVFSYKKWIEETWDGWLTVVCYMVVIGLADVANLASTALTITIQRDWIVVITGCNRTGLAGKTATRTICTKVPVNGEKLQQVAINSVGSNLVICCSYLQS
ncbi:solute carrier family 40 member 1-like [Heterodontus francisci]|uniref:solute carrier family 40 member 1-like n=1 Tax=Heterodontus francisci TaxID=7792 RepID=UPI00355AEE22